MEPILESRLVQQPQASRSNSTTRYPSRAHNPARVGHRPAVLERVSKPTSCPLPTVGEGVWARRSKTPTEVLRHALASTVCEMQTVHCPYSCTCRSQGLRAHLRRAFAKKRPHWFASANHLWRGFAAHFPRVAIVPLRLVSHLPGGPQRHPSPDHAQGELPRALPPRNLASTIT